MRTLFCLFLSCFLLTSNSLSQGVFRTHKTKSVHKNSRLAKQLQKELDSLQLLRQQGITALSAGLAPSELRYKENPPASETDADEPLSFFEVLAEIDQSIAERERELEGISNTTSGDGDGTGTSSDTKPETSGFAGSSGFVISKNGKVTPTVLGSANFDISTNSNISIAVGGLPAIADTASDQVGENLFLPDQSTYSFALSYSHLLDSLIDWKQNFGLTVGTRLMGKSLQRLKPDSIETAIQQTDFGVIDLQVALDYILINTDAKKFSLFGAVNYLSIDQNEDRFTEFFGSDAERNFIYPSFGFRVQVSSESAGMFSGMFIQGEYFHYTDTVHTIEETKVNDGIFYLRIGVSGDFWRW